MFSDDDVAELIKIVEEKGFGVDIQFDKGEIILVTSRVRSYKFKSVASAIETAKRAKAYS